MEEGTSVNASARAAPSGPGAGAGFGTVPSNTFAVAEPSVSAV